MHMVVNFVFLAQGLLVYCRESDHISRCHHCLARAMCNTYGHISLSAGDCMRYFTYQLKCWTSLLIFSVTTRDWNSLVWPRPTKLLYGCSHKHWGNLNPVSPPALHLWARCTCHEQCSTWQTCGCLMALQLYSCWQLVQKLTSWNSKQSVMEVNTGFRLLG